LLRAIEDKKFRQTLGNFDLNIADGTGVLWAAKYLSLPLTERPIIRELQAIWQMVFTGASLVFAPSYCHYPICQKFPGVEAFFLMLAVAEKENAPVYILGAQKENLDSAVSKIKGRFSGLNLVGCHEGYHLDSVTEEINRCKPKIIFVALGSPKQENWIKDNLDKLPTVKLLVGEGGTLDRIASESQLAPAWVNRVGLEWLWRLARNKSLTLNEEGQRTSRLKRVWRAVPVFIYEIVRFKIKNGSQNEKI
jgi:N-acetylglucosaminyldiphosphoundecaprenol N-acetyl-beta-D-mannosaminyltransferase